MKEGEPKMELSVDKKLEEVYKNQETLPFEREKTPEETRITEQVLEYMPEFLEKYGGGFNENLNTDNIHFIDVNKLPQEEKKKMEDEERQKGQCSYSKGEIRIFSEGENKNLLVVASTLAHELIHMNSFHSVVVDLEGEIQGTRKAGLVTATKGGGDYFSKINEGVTEELQARFDKEYLNKIPELEKDLEHRKEYAEKKGYLPEDILIYLKRETRDGVDGWLATTEILNEGYRAMVKEKVEDIYLKNKDKFESEEDVFRVFVENMLEGKTLKFAKLIEKTYGNGSFRKLGEETKK